MNKKFILVFTCLTLLILTIGCGEGDDGPATTDPVIGVWRLYSISGVFDNTGCLSFNDSYYDTERFYKISSDYIVSKYNQDVSGEITTCPDSDIELSDDNLEEYSVTGDIMVITSKEIHGNCQERRKLRKIDFPDIEDVAIYNCSSN